VIEAGEADAVGFGVPFLANPDLPERFRQGAPLNQPDPTTFYAPGAKGYTDYPTLEQTLAATGR
jgi:2,4-dienoyl-CoA reductase-like NADH-dependent reductase (Old Yellow Enzyme family)